MFYSFKKKTFKNHVCFRLSAGNRRFLNGDNIPLLQRQPSGYQLDGTEFSENNFEMDVSEQINGGPVMT